MAMDNMQIRKKQLERLDEFVHELYKETQMFKQYGEDLSDLEGLYLHIHDIIQDLLSVPTTQEFMEKVAEFHKGIAGIVVIIGAGDPHEVAEQLKKSQSSMSDMDVNEFLNNMKVKEKSNYKKEGSPEKAPEKKITEEEREQEKKDLVDTLDLNEQVSAAKPKQRNWDKNSEEEQAEEDDSLAPKPQEQVNNTSSDPLTKLWDEWKQ